MDRVVFERGARFLIAGSLPAVTTEGFIEGAFRNPELRRALSGPRVRLLQVTPLYELDKDNDRDDCRECEAVFYDYARNRTVRIRGLPGGVNPYVAAESVEQPLPSGEEFQAAVEL